MGVIMTYKGSSYINILTYIVFTIFPIIMFATMLVWRLMDNHALQVNQLESEIIELQEKLDICQNLTFYKSKRVSALLESQRKCRTTLEKVSKTLDSLSEAFKVQWKKTN